jgi:N-acetylmuramoyl-L-alanine amidase
MGNVLADRCALKNTHANMLRWPDLVRQERVAYKLAHAAGVTAILLCAAYAPARSEEAAPPAAKADGCVRSAFHVIVDVGHTAGVPGADSARGAPEYGFNLKLADVIKQALVEAGFDKTVRMITTRAPYSGLFERATRANGAHADLFISIHHDSVPDHLIETWQFDGKENHYSDRFSGYALFVSNDNGDRRGSLAFGHLLGQELQKAGLHYTPHYTLPLMGRYRHELLDAEAGVYRYDQLIVLRNTRMPAVLLEAGSIVNRKEELELGTPERRQLVAKAVVAAVEDFCTARAQPLEAQQAKPPAAKTAAHGRTRPTALAH